MQKEALIDNLVGIWQEEEITRPLPAEGRSMYPLIKNGDTVYIKFCRPEKVRTGDIIAFRRGNATIVHRLVKKINSGFLEKGDLQLRAQVVGKEDVMGRVLLGNRGLNRLMACLGYLVHKLGFIGKPLLIIPFTINTITVKIYKLCRNRKEKYTKENPGYLPAN